MTPEEVTKLESYIKTLPFIWPIAMIAIYPNKMGNYFFQNAPKFFVDITLECPETKKTMVIQKNAKDLLRKINQHEKYKHLKDEVNETKQES